MTTTNNNNNAAGGGTVTNNNMNSGGTITNNNGLAAAAARRQPVVGSLAAFAPAPGPMMADSALAPSAAAAAATPAMGAPSTITNNNGPAGKHLWPCWLQPFKAVSLPCWRADPSLQHAGHPRRHSYMQYEAHMQAGRASQNRNVACCFMCQPASVCEDCFNAPARVQLLVLSKFTGLTEASCVHVQPPTPTLWASLRPSLPSRRGASQTTT